MCTRERLVVSEEKFQRRRRNPSFSSSLLDSIYRSIDEPNPQVDLGHVSRETKKQSSSASASASASASSSNSKGERTNLRRAIMIENWVEKQSVHSSMFTNSASSSSDSSAAFSSFSDQTESIYYRGRSKQRSLQEISVRSEEDSKKPKSDTFTKTKLRALKLYTELKKTKQPISPGAKIASFLNSIFNSGNVKKAKMCYVGAVEDVSTTSEHVAKSNYSSSTASTFSRSCLSKPAKKPSNGSKRSVRFFLGEGDGSKPSSHKCVYQQDPSLMPKPTFQRYARSPGQNMRRSLCEEDDDDDDDEEEESDAESYSSSDLFELNQPVGIGRYTEELPVYETTNFRTNKAIAKGLIL